MNLKECDSFLVEFIESACEQLKCKFSTDPLEFLLLLLALYFDEFVSSRYLLTSR
jgi:hypothetical protein